MFLYGVCLIVQVTHQAPAEPSPKAGEGSQLKRHTPFPAAAAPAPAGSAGAATSSGDDQLPGGLIGIVRASLLPRVEAGFGTVARFQAACGIVQVGCLCQSLRRCLHASIAPLRCGSIVAVSS